MDIRQLQCFLRAAEAGSVSRAAAQLQLPQPAVSRHIARLERALGSPLLLRHGRGVQVTEAGARLLDHARAILDHVEGAQHEVAALRERPRGEVTIGMAPSAAQILAARFIDRLARDLPDIRLRIREGFGGNLTDWLLARTLDAAVLYSPGPARRLAIDTVFEEDLLLVGPPHHPLIRRGTLDIAALGDVPLLLPSPSQALRRTVEAAARKAGVRLNVVLELDTLAVTRALAADGRGLTILTETTVAAEIAAGRLATARFAPPLRRSVTITTAAGAALSPAARHALGLLRREMEAMVAEGAWRALPPRRVRVR
jgi:LysR family nitrogen assimilation transcriptional regulator